MSSEARDVFTAVIDPVTEKPTERGLIWLNQANVAPADILGLFGKNAMSPRGRARPGVNSDKLLASRTESAIFNSLALLKIALVMARETSSRLYQKKQESLASPIRIGNVKHQIYPCETSPESYRRANVSRSPE